ncbi:unnamed protein product [Sphagnum compactum]
MSLSIDVVGFLIQSGADLNLKGSDGQTALIAAISLIAPRHDIVGLLVCSGADANVRDVFRHTALHYASCQDCVESITLLLDHGARSKRLARDAVVCSSAMNVASSTDIDIAVFYEADGVKPLRSSSKHWVTTSADQALLRR